MMTVTRSHIALTAPITGDYSEYGKNFQRSVEMGIEFINANGGVLGKELVLSVGDSKGDPKESATLAQKWTSDPTIGSSDRRLHIYLLYGITAYL